MVEYSVGQPPSSLTPELWQRKFPEGVVVHSDRGSQYASIDEPLTDRKAMRKRVFEYIEVDYNRTRRHSALGFVSPEAFEQKTLAKSSV